MPAYDACEIPGFALDEGWNYSDLGGMRADVSLFCFTNPAQCMKGTMWMAAFSFNALVLAMNAINLIVMIYGAFYWTPRLYGTLCNFCCACCHFFAIFSTFSYRYGAYGYKCAANKSPSTYEGNGKWSDSTTYASDGQLLLVLGSVQLVFWFFQCCFLCIPLLKTPSVHLVKEEEKKEIEM